ALRIMRDINTKNDSILPNNSLLNISCIKVDNECTSVILHSFPTRRSSDLIWNHTISETLVRNAFVIFSVFFSAFLLGTGILSLRSEEHTSELQSRFDLVCRLLLEKKN